MKGAITGHKLKLIGVMRMTDTKAGLRFHDPVAKVDVIVQDVSWRLWKGREGELFDFALTPVEKIEAEPEG